MKGRGDIVKNIDLNILLYNIRSNVITIYQLFICIDDK